MNNYLDSLRVIAAFSVVLLHISGDGFDIDSKDFSFGSFNWHICNTINSLTRCCVPIFVMIAGSLAIKDSNINISTYIKKRCKRILPPLFFWSVIYLGWRMYYYDLNIFGVINCFFVKGKPYYHLWYFYMLLGLTLVTPLLSMCRKQYNDKFILVIGVVFTILFLQIPTTDGTYELITFKSSPDYLVWFLPYVGYYCLGFYFSKVKTHLNTSVCILILMISLFVTMYGSYTIGRDFHNYMALNTIVVSISLFFLFKQLIAKKNFLNKMAAYTLGIYLTHPIVLEFFYYHDFTIEYYTPFVSIFLLWFFTILLSFIITYTFRQNRYLIKVV